MAIEFYGEFLICEEYVSALEYGDFSGLNEEEETLVNAFIEGLPNCSAFEWGESSEFETDAITGLKAKCVTCKVYCPPEYNH